MTRIELFEFGDQPWFPRVLRDALRRYLAATYAITPLPNAWADCIAMLLTSDGVNDIIDLASGAAGPVPLVVDELERRGFRMKVTLTDWSPPGAPPSELKYWPHSVDARNVPPELHGIRTMFAAFHHFNPDDALGILRDAFDRRIPIAIFEATSRSAVATSILIPLLVLLLTPRVRPLTLAQIVFTYLIPILPLVIFWDGMVSHLRTYSLDDMRELTSDLVSPDYAWQIGTVSPKGVPFGAPYIIGLPVAKL